MPMDTSEEEVDQYIDEQMARIEKSNSTTQDEIAAAVITAVAMAKDDKEEGSPALKAALVATFAHLLAKRKRLIAEHESQTAYNAGMWFAGKQAGAMNKTWVTRKDTHVRAAHRELQGKSVPMGEGFAVGNESLRFPGDPLAPAGLTINCRCRLRFSIS
jgi:acyl-CoA reductase-like NAD-dependent aldehyde dehydrogenase